MCGSAIVTPPEVIGAGPSDPAAVAVREAMARGAALLAEALPSARAGDPGGVHRMRTTARRLRSELRLFRPLVDEAWATPLVDELRWLGGLLGTVRDLDVLSARLRDSAGDLEGALVPLFDELGQRRDEARGALRRALDEGRFRALMGGLEEAAAGPPLSADAEAPCGEVLPGQVRSAWAKLKDAARALGPDDPDEAYHDARKRAKKVRYAAEAVAPTLGGYSGRQAGRFARRVRRVQDALGELQDAVLAGRIVAEVAASRPLDGPFNLAAGRLLERQRRAADEARDAFPGAWRRLDRKSLRHWMKV